MHPFSPSLFLLCMSLYLALNQSENSLVHFSQLNIDSAHLTDVGLCWWSQSNQHKQIFHNNPQEDGLEAV